MGSEPLEALADGLWIAARRSLERILAWDFDRVVVSHGAVLEGGGRARLREAFAFLGDA